MVIVGPDGALAFERVFSARDLGFWGIPDPAHHILKNLGQPIKWWAMGRMPAALGVDRQGLVVWTHYGLSARDLPRWEDGIKALSDETGMVE